MNGVRTNGKAAVVPLPCFAYRPCSGQAPRPVKAKSLMVFIYTPEADVSQTVRYATQSKNLMFSQSLGPLRQPVR